MESVRTTAEPVKLDAENINGQFKVRRGTVGIGSRAVRVMVCVGNTRRVPGARCRELKNDMAQVGARVRKRVRVIPQRGVSGVRDNVPSQGNRGPVTKSHEGKISTR